jgi:oligoribonuclease
MLGIFLDTETNGLDIKRHRVLEIAFQLIDLNDGNLCDSFSSLVAVTEEEWKNSDQVSLKVNGIKWNDLRQAAKIEEVSSQVKSVFIRHKIMRGKAVFICQNPSFDRTFFSQILDVATQEKLHLPYHWLDLASMYWAYLMLQAKEKNTPMPWDTGFTKDKIAQHFHLESEQNPHRAMNGVEHLVQCYKAVIGFPRNALV